MINYELKDKVVLVTGGRKGLGSAIAKNYIAQGCKVIISGHSSSGQKDALEMGAAEYVTFSLTDHVSIEKMFRSVVEKFGRLDIFVNNAACTAGTGKPLTEYDSDFVKQVFEENCAGAFKCLQEALSIMVKQGGGSVVNIGSSVAMNGGTNSGLYATSKSAVNAMTRLAALEYAAQGVRVNAVVPGLMLTESTLEYKAANPEGYDTFCQGIPVKRCADIEEVAKAVLWLSSDDASYIYGVSLPVDGGLIC